MSDPRPAAGIYIHWPFCERKCPYCEFYTFGREHPQQRRAGDYLEALLDEIRSAPGRMGWSGRPAADAIYLGGGTPSLMGPNAVGRTLGALNEIFEIEPSAETTIEVNPTTAETAQIDRLLSAGANRFSVGVQSFNDRLLETLGRVHDAATTRRALKAMRAAGAANMSLDLIFGVPTQTTEDLRRDVEELLAFSPEHVSAYGMTYHESTPFARWRVEGRLAAVEEDAEAEMFEMLIDVLAGAGYEHYEISNWARPGRASRHNQKYWRDCDVAAFGVAAHGVWSGCRTQNAPDLDGYVDPARRVLARPLDAPKDARAAAGEVMMLALRRVQGVGWDEIDQWTGIDTRSLYKDERARLVDDGLLKDDGHTVALTRRGLLLANTVMARFF